ncbi:hypothetical protein AALP_AA8G047100 [Arabis alpina]|uniref:Uncharacterized protein n=1 Tax=Arabis alpina TaxID=50452 RepID=A0A087G4Z8_ARAAL|nr:hypothetical protein AALP_AA8G047100 [Arabis alpina]
MDRNGALILIFFVFVSQLFLFSTARDFPSVIDGVIFSGEVSVVSKTVSGEPATMVGCQGVDGRFTADYSTSRPGDYVTGKYGSLVLNVLPKGSVPASGPSKRINNVKS